MFWLVVSIALVVVAFALLAYVYYLRNIATRHIFIVNYNLIYGRTDSVAESLRQAIEVFRYRRPFDTLDDHDVDHLVAVFSPHPDPLVLADLFHNVDRRRDSGVLKDHAWVTKVANATNKRMKPSGNGVQP